jgi:hypothetical protein
VPISRARVVQGGAHLAERAGMRCLAAIALGLTLVSACAGDDSKGPEDDVPAADGKDDSFYKPTYHGFLEFGAPGFSELTDVERYSAWVFELSDTADLEITTSYAVLGQRRTDTVLYLYRETDGSWGPYIARNDDYGTTTYSKLVRTLEPGSYRVLVKGYASTTMGKFKVTANCAGPGCVRGCLFGTSYNEIATAPALEKIGALKITPDNLDTLGADTQELLVRAVQESSNTDVTTAPEALSRVDQEQMNVTYYGEPAANRTFIAFEYGAGDNSYGAVFEKQTGNRAAAIHDGDLYECDVQRETCSLPDDYATMKTDPAFEKLDERAVTDASQLSATEAAQAEIAVRKVYADPSISVADGIGMADGGSINVARYRHTATNRAVTVLEWGAGDTSVGALFHGTTTELAGVIDDLYIDGCSLFEPR